MAHHDSNSPLHAGLHSDRGESRLPSAWKGAAIMLVVIVGFYVLREHWGHALGYAPYLLLLACPLMHMFMHGGHGHQHDAADKPQDR